MWEWAHDGEGSWEKQGKVANRHQMEEALIEKSDSLSVEWSN